MWKSMFDLWSVDLPALLVAIIHIHLKLFTEMKAWFFLQLSCFEFLSNLRSGTFYQLADSVKKVSDFSTDLASLSYYLTYSSGYSYQ